MLLNFIVTKAQAAVTNPAIGELGDEAAAVSAKEGTLFTSYFLRIWNGVITIGALMVIVYFLWGSIGWITAGGDSAKIQKSRDRMVQAVIGLILLVGSFTLLGFISSTFFGTDFNILQLNFGV
ncbi:MAG: hypothetical protein OEX81_03175 [Candidatus Pacebacteria bacterium]|nr:hypothetical protein [Candidatus Paceibacterota bacterium]